ncbi:unnamed protein product, partial [Iphiclides podalirius]
MLRTLRASHTLATQRSGVDAAPGTLGLRLAAAAERRGALSLGGAKPPPQISPGQWRASEARLRPPRCA